MLVKFLLLLILKKGVFLLLFLKEVLATVKKLKEFRFFTGSSRRSRTM